MLANNARFVLLPGPRVPNLASKILAANLARLPADWLSVHGQPLLMAETFVDPTRFAGTCYRAANWIDVGATRGFAKTNATYIEHGQPKRILVYPLVRQARAILCSPLPHARLPRVPAKSLELSAAQAQTLLERLGNLPETRSQQGRRHRLASVLAVAVCAFVSGARNSAAMGHSN